MQFLKRLCNFAVHNSVHIDTHYIMKSEITFDRFIRWAGAILLVIAVLFLVNYLAGVLLPFALAWLFAYLLYPTVCFVQHRLRVRVRALAILVTLIGVVVLFGGILYFIISSMIE